jgi:hypothetical protein
MAYFGARMRTATVHSVGASLVLRLQPEHLDLIMSELPMLTRLLCRQFTWRLQESNEVIQAFQKRFDLAPERRMAAEGEILFRAGEAPRGLIQVLMGSVRVDREDGSHLLGPQDLPDGFLEPEAYLRSRPHRLTATVAGSAFLLVVAPDRKEAVVRGFPGLTLKILEGRA